MRAEAAILAACLALALAGCSLRANKKTAQAAPPAPIPAANTESAPASQPLSIPQTRVQLPSPQPLNPEALTAVEPEPPPVEPPPAPSRTSRRVSGPPAIAAPRPEPPSPVLAPAEPERQPIQEVVSADEQKRLQDAADQRKRETRALLDQARGRALSPQEKITAQSIEQLLRSSDDSQAKGDMRAASDLAYKALVLARDLQNVR
ncbi:MAG: hypothetical protein ACLQVN_23615 [Bryobacteraceae bacterium]